MLPLEMCLRYKSGSDIHGLKAVIAFDLILATYYSINIQHDSHDKIE